MGASPEPRPGLAEGWPAQGGGACSELRGLPGHKIQLSGAHFAHFLLSTFGHGSAARPTAMKVWGSLCPFCSVNLAPAAPHDFRRGATCPSVGQTSDCPAAVRDSKLRGTSLRPGLGPSAKSIEERPASGLPHAPLSIGGVTGGGGGSVDRAPTRAQQHKVIHGSYLVRIRPMTATSGDSGFQQHSLTLWPGPCVARYKASGARRPKACAHSKGPWEVEGKAPTTDQNTLEPASPKGVASRRGDGEGLAHTTLNPSPASSCAKSSWYVI